VEKMRALGNTFFITVLLGLLTSPCLAEEESSHLSSVRAEAEKESLYSKTLQELSSSFGRELNAIQKQELRDIFMSGSDVKEIEESLTDLTVSYARFDPDKRELYHRERHKLFDILLRTFADENKYFFQRKIVQMEAAQTLAESLELCRIPELTSELLKLAQDHLERHRRSFWEGRLHKFECLRRHQEAKLGAKGLTQTEKKALQNEYDNNLKRLSYEFSKQYPGSTWKKIEEEALKSPHSEIDPERFEILREISSLPSFAVVQTNIPINVDGPFTTGIALNRDDEGNLVWTQKINYGLLPSKTFAIICENGKCSNGASEEALKYVKRKGIAHATTDSLKGLGEKSQKGLQSGAEILLVSGHGNESGLTLGAGGVRLTEENVWEIADKFRGYKLIIFNSCKFGLCSEVNGILAGATGAQVIANDSTMYSASNQRAKVGSSWIITTPISSDQPRTPSFMVKKPSLWERYGLCSPSFPCQILSGSR
jgi:hypothetical protein